MSIYNNFELLLFAASEACCNKQAEEFLLVNDDNFGITKQQQKRMKQIEREYTKKEKRSIPKIKWIAIACILSISMLFTACVSIPKIREAIKDFFLEWYDDFVSIGFGDKKEDKFDYGEIEMGETADVDLNESTSAPEESLKEDIPPPPTEIMRRAYVADLPENYTYEVDLDSRLYYAISYYEEGNYVFSVTQNIITQELNWANTKSQKIYVTSINGFNAMIIEAVDVPGVYQILWQDNEYEYNIEGYFSDVDEIIGIAESVKLN